MAATVRRLGRAALVAEKHGKSWKKPALSLRKQALLRKRQRAALGGLSSSEASAKTVANGNEGGVLALNEVQEFDAQVRSTLLGWQRRRASVRRIPKGHGHHRRQAKRAEEITANLEKMPQMIESHRKALRDAKPKSFLDKILNKQYAWES